MNYEASYQYPYPSAQGAYGSKISSNAYYYGAYCWPISIGPCCRLTPFSVRG